MFIFLTLVVSLVVLLLHIITSRKSNYWKSRGFLSIPHGVSLWEVFTGRKQHYSADNEYYETIGKMNERSGGILEFGTFGTPILFIKDLDLARDIFIKDFDHFADRRLVGKVDKIFGDGLFGLSGQEWKDMRAFVSPTFTSGRIRNMFRHFVKSATHLNQHLTPKNTNSSCDILITESMRKYVVEIIGSAVLGLDVNAFSNQGDKFHTMSEKLLTFGLLRSIRLAIMSNFSWIAEPLNITFMEKDVTDFFTNVITSSLTARQEGSIKGNDFLQMLVDAQNNKLSEDKEELSQEEKDAQLKPNSGANKKNIKWNNDLAVGQSFLFFTAGFDSVSNNLAVCCYLLAIHEDIQDKVYEEVSRIFDTRDKNISYEDANKLEYLDMVISEVLRIYPVVTRLDRMCVRDYVIPPSKEGEKSKVIQKGTVVAIPAESIHKDEQYFPNPLKFDPERFSQENKAKRNPYAYMPFGIGPRNCVGMRFAMTETKVALANLVHNFVIGPTETTPIPEKMTLTFLGYKVASGVELKFTPRIKN